MDKFKMDAYKGISIIRCMIKDSALHKEMGVGVSWLNQKIRRKEERERSKGFTESDIELITSAMKSLSNQIRAHILDDSMNHEEIAAHLNEVCKVIPAKYIYTQIGRNKDWWRYNICGKAVKELTIEEIMRINLVIVNVAILLSSIELSL